MRKWVKDLMVDTPEMLTWTEEPGAKAGDTYVFAHKKIHYHDPVTHITHAVQVPDVYIRLTANPIRRRTLRGDHWYAPYCWSSQEEYLAFGAGTVTDPRRSPDPERPIAPVRITPADHDRNREMAAAQRKTERLAARRDPYRRGRMAA